MTIGAPHSLQISSVGLSGILSRPMGFENLHSAGYLAHAMYGPKRPERTSSGEPHVGHFSRCRLWRSCTSLMIRGTSTDASWPAKGVQNPPSTCCQGISPSSTLSSSVSICAVKPTWKVSGKQRCITFHTFSPRGVGEKRRSFIVAYQRACSVEMIAAYVDGRPIPCSSSIFTRDAWLYRGGGS